jgi:hypothetical protein
MMARTGLAGNGCASAGAMSIAMDKAAAVMQFMGFSPQEDLSYQIVI